MYKQYLLVLVAAGLISVGATVTAAQDNPPSDQPAAQSQDGGHMHHAMDPAHRAQELSKKLKLTSDQQTKVQDILQSEKSQMEGLHQDSSMSQQDRRTKMMDIHKTSDTQIRALLDSTQQKKWDEMVAKREQWMQNRHSGAPGTGSEQPSQPPQ
jgi:Spy/CpxP family protein refolding chaperone